MPGLEAFSRWLLSGGALWLLGALIVVVSGVLLWRVVVWLRRPIPFSTDLKIAAKMVELCADELARLPLSDFAKRSVRTRAQDLRNLATELRRLAYHVEEDFRRGEQ